MYRIVHKRKKIRLLKAKSDNAEEILNRISRYLNENAEEPVNILTRFWNDQQKAITYSEIRQIVLAGMATAEMINEWMHDYSILVSESMAELWKNAIEAGTHGQPLLDDRGLRFNMTNPGVNKWITERGAQFVTNAAFEQEKAISTLLLRGIENNLNIDEMARNIRMCIGLTSQQTSAAVNLYANAKEKLRKQHPKMHDSTIETKARHTAQLYAERAHRQRALTIAQTEMAHAYNQGTDMGMRQAYAENLVGMYIKKWSTSGDDRVCSYCADLDGEEVGMEGSFDFGKGLFQNDSKLPPAHPRCACAIEYIEVEPPKQEKEPFNEPEFPGFENDPFTEENVKVYTQEEIEAFAERTEKAISKYISTPTKWSGNIVVDDEYEKYGKLWNCDITTNSETSPYIVMHEQLHSRSISYFTPDEYNQWQVLEEASVEFAAQEIGKAEGITLISSGYEENVVNLKAVCRRINGNMNDLQWAVTVLEQPLPERFNWLSEMLYETFMTNGTIEEYAKYTSMLNILSGG